jgi:aspartate aminotransferase
MNLSTIGISPTLETMQRIKHLRQQGEDVLQLGFGQSPFPIPELLCKECEAHCSHGEYLPVQGLPQLRKAIADYYNNRDGLQLTEDNVIVGPGSKELLFLLQFVTKHYELYLPTPSWVSYPTQSRIIGREPYFIHTTRSECWKLTIDNCQVLNKSSKQPRMLIINYPNNPTGLTYSTTELEGLVDIFKNNQVTVVQDEIYHQLSYGKSISLTKLIPDQVIISSGISKSCSAGGWRIGYLILPNNLLDIAKSIVSLGSETYSCAPVPAQYACCYLFNNLGTFHTYWQDCVEILRRVGHYCASKFNEHGIRCHAPEGAYYILLDFSDKLHNFRELGINSSQQLCNKLLHDTKIAMLPGSAFSQLPSTLTARFCYVDFDGKYALQHLRKKSQPMSNDDWIAHYCPNIIKGLQLICEWYTRW